MHKPIRFSPNALTPKHASKLTALEKGNKGSYLHIDDLRALVIDFQFDHPGLEDEERKKMNQLYLRVLGI